MLTDRAVQANFVRITESLRRLRRINHILLDALLRSGTGFALPSDLQDEFKSFHEATKSSR